LNGEILIADNGSTDGSQLIARALGAMLIEVSQPGYGAALASGMKSASGTFLVMGDADRSYDFRECVEMIRRQPSAYWRLEPYLRRPLALAYIAGYSAICLFWISYWQIMIEWQGFSRQASSDAGPVYFMARAAVLLANFDWTGAGPMLKNMLRFIDWQNPDTPAFVGCRVSFDPRSQRNRP
jgi:glycosyltransferase involved in cell wall biosynthesis